jgi:3-oxoacyl-[acyl-carrier-protein] synthase-3
MASRARARQPVALSSITGIGVNRPAADAILARRVSGTDVTGVSYRVQAEHGVTTASLAAGAARAALRASKAEPSEVGMIVVGTTSPDVLWPSTACLVQTELRLPMVAAFDLYAAQASLLAALDVGIRYVGGSTVLLIGADSDNQLVDLPGQGKKVKGRAAAAAVLRAADGGIGVLSTVTGGAARAGRDGDNAAGAVIDGLREGVETCLDRASLSLEEIDLVVGDQASPDVMDEWSKEVELPSNRLLLDPARYGALLSAAPLTALHDAALDGRLQDGMMVLLLECGSGPVWGAACLRWGATEVSQW